MFASAGLKRLRERARALVGTALGYGLSPHRLSLTICLGGTVGVMPLAWGTTVLCVLLAAKLRLNQAAMLAVNYLCYPLQLILFLPFCRLGEFLFPWGYGPGVEMAQLSFELPTLNLVLWSTARALGAWSLTVLPLALLAFPIVKGILRGREQRPHPAFGHPPPEGEGRALPLPPGRGEGKATVMN